MVLAVTFRGQATHHLVTLDPTTGTLAINNKSCEGCTDIKQMLEFLRTKRSFWPVPLTSVIENPALSGGEPTPAAAPVVYQAPKPAAVQPQQERPAAPPQAAQPPPLQPRLAQQGSERRASNPLSFMHNVMSKDEADKLISDSGPASEGKFFIRRRAPESIVELILTVIYKGKPTHHLVSQNPVTGLYSVNKVGKSTLLAMRML